MEPLRKNRIAGAILLVIVFFGLGVYVGFFHQPKLQEVLAITGGNPPIEIEEDFSPFWKTWDTLNKKYPGVESITDEEKLYGAISGLVDSLNDPYTVFYRPDEAQTFNEDISGSFSGIGVEVGKKDGVLTVIAPLKGSPGEKAGVRPGDKILKIDDTETANLSLEESVRIIRGKSGEVVTLTILRPGERTSREIRIVRGTITLPTLETELRSDGIFVIRLYSFSGRSTALFRNAIGEFARAKTDKLIIDLRGNPGGYLDSAVDIASYLLPQGKTVLIEDYGPNKKQKIFRSKGYATFSENLKLAVLIDEGSASASEILAGALQDHGVAKIVGEQSHGKGSVQEVIKITSDTLLKVTVARWLTPNGISLSEKGLTPDFPVAITAQDETADRDPQLDKAVELLKNWQ